MVHCSSELLDKVNRKQRNVVSRKHSAVLCKKKVFMHTAFDGLTPFFGNVANNRSNED